MPAYTELHCHSHYSLLDGASSPEALALQARDLGLTALALTDHDGLYGVVPFALAMRELGLHPVIGAELTLETGAHLLLLAETQEGYSNLCRLISAAQLAGQKGQPRLTDDLLATHARGLIALSACQRGDVPAALLRGEWEAARQRATWYRDVFGPRGYYLELQCHWLQEEHALNAELLDLAHELDIPYVATNNVHYAQEEGYRLHDVLTAIREHSTVEELGERRRPNSEYYLKPPQQMVKLFEGLPQALANTFAIAERCQVQLNFRAQALPACDLPAGQSADAQLRALCEARLAAPPKPLGDTPQRARAQLERELAVIAKAELAGYFLVVWELVEWARAQHIRMQGRGSAAGSLVAYLLGISPVDPLEHHLLFERFLTGDPQCMPDIDIDIAADRREEVIQHVYERYGVERTAMVCNVVTYRTRSAMREVAKALGYGPEFLAQASRLLRQHRSPGVSAVVEMLEAPNEETSPPDPLPGAGRGNHDSSGPNPMAPPPCAGEGVRGRGLPVQDDDATSSPTDPPKPIQLLLEMSQAIAGCPRHLSIHVGGMIITGPPLVSLVPVERATMPGRVVVQWNKDSVEDAGLIKLDLLSLRTLGMVEEAARLVRETEDASLDLDHLPPEDPEIYRMISAADTMGVFQVESRAQMDTVPRTRPRTFADLVVEVALIRPGPLQGGMVHPYLRRRAGQERVTYLHPSLKPALAETLGVIVFQEQVLLVAMAAGGFTAPEADRFRRLLGRRPSPEALAPWHERFERGAAEKGIAEERADVIFKLLSAFAGYGFCKSHAAAFALVTYQTAYLKRYHHAALTCALLNHQPMGFYGPRHLIRDAQRHGVRVLGVDVNRSHAECVLEGGAVRLGYRYVDGLGDAACERWTRARAAGPFHSLDDFWRRAGLPRSIVSDLIRVGAMDSWGTSRRALLWELSRLDDRPGTLAWSWDEPELAWAPMSAGEKLQAEYEVLGLGIELHPLSLYREQLRRLGAITTQELEARRNGERVRIAGEVVVRQSPPTASGTTFIMLEDEEGICELVLSSSVAQRYQPQFNAPLLLAEGFVMVERGVIQVRAERIEPIGEAPAP